MKALFLKDLRRIFPLYISMILLFSLFYLMERADGGNMDGFIFYSTIFTLGAVFAVIIHIEKYEDKYNGIRILETLPITKSTFIEYKLVFPLIFIFFHLIIWFIIVRIIYGSDFDIVYLINALVIALCSIVFLSGFYILIIKKGYNKFHVPLLGIYMVFLVASMLLLTNNNFQKKYIEFLNRGLWLILLVFAGIINYMSIRISKKMNIVCCRKNEV
jgi:hypothetical protein